MSKLDALTTHIRTHLPERIAQVEFTSAMDEVGFIKAERDLGRDHYQLAVMVCEVTLAWGRFPYREYDPCNLCALLLTWQIEHACDDLMVPGLPQVPPDIAIVLNEASAVVEVSMTLHEPLIIAMDAHGDIPFDGKHWRLAEPSIWWATDLPVITTTRAPHDED
ncbi:phage tail protein [Sodalis endosymbiont of Spalangia cameroni]|uniref:phage tail protein n=1 Tax=Sodalis praecaptivus TaxID=1239307 RepID=UPI0031FA0AE0